MEKIIKKLSLEEFITAILKEKYEEYSKIIDGKNKLIKFNNQYKTFGKIEESLEKDFNEISKISTFRAVIVHKKTKVLSINDYRLPEEDIPEGIENYEFFDYDAIKKELKKQGIK